jgi:hypothetical protein
VLLAAITGCTATVLYSLRLNFLSANAGVPRSEASAMIRILFFMALLLT